MIAFGPYKDEETVDFTELGEHRLFVVSGSTGSGKTTIFDAICFALYGQASGDDRSDSRMLRSHFADDDIHTSVEFRFELKGRVYQVFRQLPHVKAGNKSETGERHELYEVVGDRLVPLTDRQSKRPVDEKLLQLIGLTREQFSQIVMLPQGEFRKFLVSDTDNKEKILRNIFKTGRFKIVETELDVRRRAARQELDERLKVRAVFIHSLLPLIGGREASPLKAVLEQEHHNVHQVLSGLEEELAVIGADTARQSAELEAESEALKRIAEQVNQARMLEERFRELAEASARLETLEGQAGAFDAKRRECEAAKQAKQLRVYDEHHESLRQEVDGLRSALQTARREAAAAGEALMRAEADYRREEGRAALREQLIRETARLTGFLPAVESLERARQTADRLQREIAETAERLQAAEEQWAKAQARRTELQAAIKEGESRIRTLPDKAERLTALREQAKLLQDYIRLEDAVQAAGREAAQLRERFAEADAAYVRAERRWFDGQAAVLAAHLHDGQPCPVCGSTVHPHKAASEGTVPSRQELELLRRERGEREQAYLAAAARHKHLEQQFGEAGAALAQAGTAAAEARAVYAGVVEEGKRLAAEVGQLKAEQERSAEYKAELEKCEADADRLAGSREETRLKLQELRANLEKEWALLDQSIREVPEELRTLDELKRAIAETEGRKRQMDADWQQAQTNLQQSRERHLAAAKQEEHLIRQEADATGKLEKAKAALEEAMAAAGFPDAEAYRAARRTDAEIAELERDLEAYRHELQAARSRFDYLQAYLQDKSRPDLAALQARMAESEARVESSRQRLVQLQTLAGKLQDIRENIEQADRAVQEAEAEFSRIRELYELIRGDNPAKMSFERYLQIEFLDQIVEAANRRLQQLSGGQFVLCRSERLESRGKQSGLGLDVFDHYTGQFRDVKTLSGGEKFNASLCLALGMADVIQSYQGGISIETMLIDEGFGSLDEESLHKAIETLFDLQQSGRLVGVISHVAELKQAFPAVLEVVKTKEGTSRTRFLVS
jgi:exonuclease SbcC